MAAEILPTWNEWSTNESANQPDDGVDLVVNTPANLRRVQAVLKKALAFKGADIASAASIDLNVDGAVHTITGTVTISALGTVSAGVKKLLIFQSALMLSYNAVSLVIPGGKSISVLPETVVELLSIGSGNWQVLRIFPGKSTHVVGFTLSTDLLVVSNFVGVQQFITISAETGTADTVAAIDSTNLLAEGSRIIVRPLAGHSITLKYDDVAQPNGRLKLITEGVNYVLERSSDNVSFIKVGTDWVENARSARVSRILFNKTSNQAITSAAVSGVVTTIGWQSGGTVAENMTFNAGGNSATILYTGWYQATLNLSWDLMSSGVKNRLLLQVNGVTQRQYNMFPDNDFTEGASAMIISTTFPLIQLNKDDVVTFAVAQFDSATRNLVSNNANTVATLALV
jgi:hypothetical protein